MVSVVPVLSWLAALICAAVAVAVAVAGGPRPVSSRFAADRLLRYLMLFPVGLMGLWAALGHLVFPAESAQAIGWATSPFQSEVGSANLGVGLAGLYAAFSGWRARFATSLVVAGFLGGAGVVHIHDIVTAGNFAPGNAGPILVTDLLTPIALFALLAITRPRSHSDGTT